MKEILNDKSWQNRFSKRGQVFYDFIEEWARYVNRTIVIKDHIPWQDLPGYNAIVKAFLIELKMKDVKRYPESLIRASHSLLVNEKLLNTYITIIYNKTK